MCKLCGAPIALGTFEIDHVIPVSQSFSGQQQELQALCLECHRTKTSLEGNHSTTLESRFSRYAYQNYAASPRLPPLVFQLQKWDDARGGLVHQSVIYLQASLAEIAFIISASLFSLKEKNFFVLLFLSIARLI